MFQIVFDEFSAASKQMLRPLAEIAGNVAERLPKVYAKAPHLVFMCQGYDNFDRILMLRMNRRLGNIEDEWEN